jgi:zinc D-Ala-D-Ala carboxypeptidase
MLLPNGISVNSNTPIYSGSHFTWGEATNKCTRPIQDLVIDGKLKLSSDRVLSNIISTAKSLDRVRRVLGDRSLYVNSWYRPAHINARVGGARNSRHQYGDAVDIRSDYYSPQQIYRLLHEVHMGGLGRYYGFVHIDWRGEYAPWSA